MTHEHSEESERAAHGASQRGGSNAVGGFAWLAGIDDLLEISPTAGYVETVTRIVSEGADRGRN